MLTTYALLMVRHIERRGLTAAAAAATTCVHLAAAPDAMRVDVDTRRESHPLYGTTATVRFKAGTKH